MYQKEMCLRCVLSPDAVSTSTVQKSFEKVTNRLDVIVYGTLGSALSGNTVINALAGQLRGFKQELQLQSTQLSTKHSRKITNEFPINYLRICSRYTIKAY